MTTVHRRPGRLTMTVARLLTEAFSPVVLAIGVVLVVGAASHPRPLVGLAWGTVAAVFVGVIPYAFLLAGIRRGRWTGRHVPQREQRTVPLLFAGASAIVGILLLAAAAAPRQLVALVIAGVVGLAVTVTITLRWKMSIHTGVAAGTATILQLVFGPWLLLVWPLVAAVGWSRLQLRDHNVAQVVAGGVIGAVIAGTVFTTLS